MSPTTMVVVSHTHWDREWYLSFQQFRARLVEMMDALLALLAREPRFTSFTLDGQTVLLEDYLEVRPEKRAEIQQWVHQGRLLIGPWYTSSDQFLVSAEALIRNLMLGHRLAAEFGRPMKVGYLPDSFGQMAQLPQILRGFGIEAAVFWRGVGDEPGGTEFRWRAPDGSTVLAVHLLEGYGNAADLPAEREALVERLTVVREQLAARATTDQLLLMNGGDHKWPQENLPQVLALAAGALEEATLVQGTLPDYIAAIEKADPPLPMVEGELRCARYTYLLPGTLSSRMPLKQRNAAIQTLLERWAEPFYTWAASVAGNTPANMQPLIWQAWKYLLQNHAHDSICGCTIDAVQRDMEVRFDWAEEIGEEVVRRSLQTIARHIDTTGFGEEEIPAESASADSPASGRFGVRLAALPLTGREVSYIVVFNPLSVPRSDAVTVSFQPLTSLEAGTFAVTDSQGHVVPHQILSGETTEVFSADASPEEFAAFMQMIDGGEVFDLRITSLDLCPLETDMLGITATLVKKGTAPEVDFEAIKRRIQAVLQDGTWQRFHLRAYFAPQVHLSFLAEDVPGCGYKTYALQRAPGDRHRAIGRRFASARADAGGRAEAGSPRPSARLDPSAQMQNGVLHGHQPPDDHRSSIVENEFYAVTADAADGTLTITDKQTGLVYRGCNRFVDEGEAGDLYWHEPPARDLVVDEPAEPPRVTVEESPLGATLQVEMVYALPAGLTEDRGARSEQRVRCPIVSRISLRPGVRRVDVHTVVENRAGNHRLRVHFPTPIETDHSCADGAFGTVERPVDVPSGEGWVERPVGTHPQGSFVVAVASDGTKGLMVINQGLPEYEFLPSALLRPALSAVEVTGAGEGGVTVALTLLRCVDRLSRGAEVLTPLAQCQGRQVFEYALVPHSGDWREAALYHEAHAFNAPLRALVTDVHGGALPLEQSFASVEPKTLVVSVVKPVLEGMAEAGDGLILRLYNPTPQELEGRVRLYRPFARAHRVRLDEEDIEALPLDPDGGVRVRVGQNAAVTIKPFQARG